MFLTNSDKVFVLQENRTAKENLWCLVKHIYGHITHHTVLRADVQDRFAISKHVNLLAKRIYNNFKKAMVMAAPLSITEHISN